MNAVEIEEAISLLAEQDFDPVEFPYSFLEAFGNKHTTIKRLRTGNNNKSDVDGGVLQHNNIHIAVSGEGAIADTLKALKESPATTKAKAKFILATDGIEFQAEDLNSGETVACDYKNFHNHFGFFLPLAGISTIKQIRESAFDIKATSRLNKLYIELLRHNEEWATAEKRHDMNHFLARLIFCFFAEDTDIFNGEDLFTSTVQQMSANDASDTHTIISEIFRAMDIKQNARSANNVKSWANKFPYVNGDLFSGSTDTPKFTKIARSYLLHVGSLDWKKINPDIFGSMIQAVADEDERGALGMHYTSVPNILKVLNPLFLDDLRIQLNEASDNPRKLLNLSKRISRIRVFDPACGSGNFLVIAYKELRKIEHEINERRGEPERLTEIPLTNFRGIEIRDFSAEIARLALIIAEYQCNVLYRGQKQALAEFLPLNAENWITCGNALQINWLSVCPPTGTGVKLFREDLFSTPMDQAEIDFENEGGETFICGNPPYLGSTWQSKEQKSDLEAIFKGQTNTWKALDYVAGWFMKAVEFGKYTNSEAAFVSTNSICQGQQVPFLWPLIYKAGYNISFAHLSFKWKNLASHNAGVIVVIVGLAKQLKSPPKLFHVDDNDENFERTVKTINPYLVAAPVVIVDKAMKPLNGLNTMDFGNKADDGGHLTLKSNELSNLNLSGSSKSKFIKRFYGSKEFINGETRYCIWIKDEDLKEAMEIPSLEKQINLVKESRLKSKDAYARSLAKRPHQFKTPRIAESNVIVTPRVSSENRPYLPVGVLENNAIIGDRNFALYDSPIWCVAIIASRLHWVWVGTVCVRLGMSFSYSNTLGWNTFPLPKLTQKNKKDLTSCAEEILVARERHFPATIADLYDSDKMPEDLRLAHERNDEVLERIYIGRRFKNDTERLEKLFELYNKMTKGKNP
jgi:hypothetical protein